METLPPCSPEWPRPVVWDTEKAGRQGLGTAKVAQGRHREPGETRRGARGGPRAQSNGEDQSRGVLRGAGLGETPS